MDPLLTKLEAASLGEEKDDRRKDEIDEEEEDDGIDISDIIPSTSPVPRPRPNGRQTGPKGVLADHAYYKSVMSQAQDARTRAHNARVLAKAATTTTHHEDEEAAKDEAELVIQELEVEEARNDEDREALKQYRQKRLEELQALNAAATKRKQFGSVQEITSAQYASAVDNEWRTVPVIIHLFDNSIPQCRLVHEHLQHLARKYTLAKFLKVQARDVEFDLVESPAILAYKGGVLVANLVRVTDEVGETGFDADKVEDMLLKYGAISEEDIFEVTATTTEDDDDD
ncbi:thioredoxin-like protein [Jimgerdemannia flammicorona]|uniref:Thioredoxin-like protein n=1 Tax=Jimgerdemannia flammicorona TaxID=994334 RepID=A0A433D8K9_9FUNG|nr:thioredoxin-like protein [Jimgerdemannia flammicorona]